MDQRLEIKVEQHPGGWLLALTGVIDETFKRGQLVEGRQGVLVLDLDNVRRITSYGVREWVLAMSEVQGHCFFIRCRPAIVSQFNMVGNFGGHGQLVSMYAPYACARCGMDIEVLVDRRQGAASLAPANVTCPECRTPAEFDDIPETFFSYAMTAPPPLLPPAAEAIIDRSPKAAAGRLRVEKEVQGEVTVLWLHGPLDHSAHLKRVADGLQGTVVVVLSGVTSVSDDGLTRFQALAQSSGARIHVARVPICLWAALRRAPEVLGRATVLSVRVPFACWTCGRRLDVDADLVRLRQIAAGDGPPVCSICDTPLGHPGVDKVQGLLELPFVETPAHVEECNLKSPSDGLLESTATASRVITSPGAPLMTPISTRVTELQSVPDRLHRYEILRRLAVGGMATVYLGRMLGAGGFERQVAIKLMHPHIAANASFVAMFLDEARLAARIHHPNVVATLDIDQKDDLLFIVMEYIEGLTVQQVTARFHQQGLAVPTPHALRMIIDALAGLHAAHELGGSDGRPLHLVHRDVSPPNMIVGVDGLTRVTDFGIARASSRVGLETKTGEIKGKIRYMSPEQLRSAPLDCRSDVYAMGVVLWEMLAWRSAIRGDTEGATLVAALQGITQSPHEINSAAEPAISAACMRALTQDPEWRVATAAAFAEDLERAAHEARVPIATTRDVGAMVKQLMALETRPA